MASLIADLLRPTAASGSELSYPWAGLPLEVGTGRRAMLEEQRRAVRAEGPYPESMYRGSTTGHNPLMFEAHSAADGTTVLAKTARHTTLCQRVVRSLVALALGDAEQMPTPSTGQPGVDDEREQEAAQLMSDSDAGRWISSAMMNAGEDGDSFIDVVRFDDGSVEVQVLRACQSIPVYHPSSFLRLQRFLLVGREEGSAYDGQTPLYWKYCDANWVAWGTSLMKTPGTPDQMVPNTLGVLPVVHLRALWDEGSAYGTWLAGSVYPRTVQLDSMESQRMAVQQHTADPKYLIRGRVAEGEWRAAGHGKVIFTGGRPEEIDVTLLELRGNTLQHMNEAIRDTHAAARTEEPALAVAMPGANTSGVAWGIRTLGLSGVVAMLRRHLSKAIAETLGRYRALSRNERYDPDWARGLSFKFDSSPRTDAAALQALVQLVEMQVLTVTEARAYAKKEGLLLEGFPVQPAANQEQG